jgi:hypothetical protein
MAQYYYSHILKRVDTYENFRVLLDRPGNSCETQIWHDLDKLISLEIELDQVRLQAAVYEASSRVSLFRNMIYSDYSRRAQEIREMIKDNAAQVEITTQSCDGENVHLSVEDHNIISAFRVPSCATYTCD